MGGDTGVTSVPGQGSTFWFTARLKIVPGESSRHEAYRSAAPEDMLKHRYSGNCILLVDDDPVNREVALSMLEDALQNVDMAENVV